MTDVFKLSSLTLKNITNIQNAALSAPTPKYIKIEYEDGKIVKISKRYFVFSLFFWKILVKWKIKITSDMHIEAGSFDSKAIAANGTKIINKIIAAYENNKKMELSKIISILNYDLWKFINELMNFTFMNCQEYHKSLNIHDLAVIKKSKTVQNLIKMKSDPKVDDVSVVEAELKEKTDKLYKFLQKPEIEPGVPNKLYPFLNLRFIRSTQIHHIFNWIGYRTDIDDSIVSYCINSGYLEGLNNIYDFMIESLSAKKSIYYQKNKVPEAQYFLRTQHLLCSSISKIYPGDCGSRIPTPFMVTEKNAPNLYGKNIILDNDDLLMLTHENIPSFIGKEIKLKSICKYTDGVCEACGGKMFEYIRKNVNIGIYSSLQVGHPTVQTLLSAKHYQATSSIEYEIPIPLTNMFLKHKQNIFFRQAFRTKLNKISIGFPIEEAKQLMNINTINITNVNSINENNFGFMTQISVKMKGDITIHEESLEKNKQYPLLSKEIIMYIKEHPKNISMHNGIYWIDLKDFKPSHPIFKTIISNDSVVEFVKDVSGFIKSKASKYASFPEVLKDFSEIIYSRLNINISFIEVMLRAYMITNNVDYRVPEVTDVENCKFGTSKNTNSYRSFGTMLAFERVPKALDKPMLYMVPKKHYMMDHYLNYKKKDI